MTICLNFPNWSPPLPLSMSQPCYSALPTPRPVPLCLHYMHNPLCHYVCVCSTFYHSDIRGTFVKIRELQYTVTVLLYCTLVQNDARNCDAELHCEVRVKYNAVISAPTSDLPVLLPSSTLPITSNPFHPPLSYRIHVLRRCFRSLSNRNSFQLQILQLLNRTRSSSHWSQSTY